MKSDKKLNQPSTTSKFSDTLARLYTIELSLLLVCLAALHCGFGFYPLNLLCHFPAFYLLLGVGGLLFSIKKRRLFDLCVALLLCGYSLWAIRPYSVFSQHTVASDSSHRSITAGEGELRVVTWNVHTSNQEMESGLTAIKNLSPDIVLFLETNDIWEQQIFAKFSDYKYRASKPSNFNFGLTLVSKRPINDAEIKSFGSSTPNVVIAELEDKGRKVIFYGIHTRPPMDEDSQINQDTQLALVATDIANRSNAAIVAGDLNATMWATNYQNFLKTSQLQDPRLGRGLFGTWLFPLHLGLPIDHILPSNDFEIKSISNLDRFGSDHLPLVLDVQLRK